MAKLAFIFPGQGAQYVGMGEDFYKHYSESREVFQQADQLLNFNLTKLIFQGPLDQLTQTINCQLAVFTVSLALLRALESECPGLKAEYTAGLSLGEYTALTAAGALKFEQALRLVKLRAESMQQAAQSNPGGMVSVLGLSLDQAEEICRETQAEIANLNCPGQIVISGTKAALNQLGELALAKGAKKLVPLNVAGGFHSSLMAPARERLQQALAQVEIRQPKISVISNFAAQEETAPDEIRENLARQLTSRTRWEDSINFLSSCGIRKFIEIGPGKVLKGLLRKIDPDLKVYSIEQIKDLAQIKEDNSLC